MKKIWTIIIIVLLIVLAVILSINGRPQENTQNNNMENSIKKEHLSNNEENILNEETTNNEENDVNKNTIANDEVANGSNSNNDNQTSSTEIFEETPKSDEEKAIQIVKKDWKNNTNNVKFSSEGMDENGKYIISVRDIKTTEALAFYTVNINNGTFTKRLMN